MKKISTEETIILAKIALCKNQLRKLEHYTDEWVEGELSTNKWEEVKAQRKELRALINQYEQELNALRK